MHRHGTGARSAASPARSTSTCHPTSAATLHVLPAGHREQPHQRARRLRRAADASSTQQQNDGRTMNGDPMGIAPYAVTKWAAQEQRAPRASPTTAVAPTSARSTRRRSPTDRRRRWATHTYQVLNPAFATGDSASFGRLFYNVVRNDAPQELKDVFKAGGYLCQQRGRVPGPVRQHPAGHRPDASPALRPGQLTAPELWWRVRVSPPPHPPPGPPSPEWSPRMQAARSGDAVRRPPSWWPPWRCSPSSSPASASSATGPRTPSGGGHGAGAGCR